MAESSVTYVTPSPNGGAIPAGTPVATHDRASDGKLMQDVYIDNLPPGASTSVLQVTGTAYLAALLSAVQNQVSTLNPQQIGVDAGGIQRFAQQTTLFDGKILNADDLFLWENIGTGSGTFSGNKYNMAVTSGQYLIKQTRRRFPYFSGKSQRVEETFDTFGAQAGVVKRFGYFSSDATGSYTGTYDGFWLENNGTTITLNAARNGTMTLNALPLANWSGYADLGTYQNVSTWNNFTVVEFKFLWLGGAVLVVSMKTPTGFVEAHRFDYAGSDSDVFISSPNQPLRYEIRSSNGSGSFRYICSQVSTEGSVNESGQGLAVFNTTPVTTNTPGTIYALLGIKKRTTYRDNAIQIVEAVVSNTASTDAGIMVLIINPTLSAPLTYANNSRIQVGIATNQTITAGTGRIIAAAPVTTTAGGVGVMKDNYLGWLSSTINNTHDEYILGYIPTTNNQTVNGILNLKEH